jgi:hypothetical protein
VRYAPIVTCQRMVGRIPGGGGLEGPWAAFVGAVESGLLATVLTRTHAGPLWPRERISRLSAKGRTASIE